MSIIKVQLLSKYRYTFKLFLDALLDPWGMSYALMQALGLVKISKNRKSTVSETEGVLDETWAILLLFFIPPIIIIELFMNLIKDQIYWPIIIIELFLNLIRPNEPNIHYMKVEIW